MKPLTVLPPPGASGRLSHLDWLRIIVVAMLIPFHSAMTFGTGGWYILNATPNPFLRAFVWVLDKYHMELLFLIAGVATWFSLGSRTLKEYLKERLLRLVVPLVFGVLVIVPPCYYYSKLHFDTLFRLFSDTNYWTWFVNDWLTTAVPFQTGFRAGALWFLWYLVLFTFLLFPVMYSLRKKWKNNARTESSGFAQKPGVIFLFVIPIVLVEVFAQWRWTIDGTNYRLIGWIMTGDFQVLYYMLFFLFGFIIYSSSRLQKSIDKSGIIAIIGAVLTMTFYLFITFPAWNKSVMGEWYWTTFKDTNWHTAGRVFFNTLLAFTTWFWIVAILYLARKFLNISNRFVKWGNDAVLPVYIVHSTFIAVASYYVVKWDMEIIWKYLIIVAITYAGSWAFLEIFKTNNVTRFLMGIRFKKKAAVVKQ